MNPCQNENLTRILDEIAQAVETAGRSPETVKLLAVSKTRDVDEIRAFHDAGQLRFGENRVQELADKVEKLPGDIEWHLIGHLQKNKVRQAVLAASWIHSVDSSDLVRRIQRIAEEENRHPTVLLQVNVSGEDTKYGMVPDNVAEAFEASLDCPALEIVGLMTMAPFHADEKELHRVFCELRNLRDGLRERYGAPLPELSMGMSSDYRIAIAEGATIVRIGTALFGARPRR